MSGIPEPARLQGAVRGIAVRALPRRSDFPQDRRTWLGDLLAGLTVGVVALPLALGFGIGAGMGALPGLITAIVAGVVAAAFGGSNLQVSGPTGAMTVVLVPVIAQHGVGAVPLLAVLAGVLVVLGGLLGLGRAVTLVPWPVVEGFTVGIATIIFLQQVPLVLDVSRSHATSTLAATRHALSHAHWSSSIDSLAVAAGVVVAMVVLRRIRPTFPGSLAAIVVAAIVVAANGLAVRTIGVVQLDQLGARPYVPGFDELRGLLPAAAVIALLAALESLLSARVSDGMSDLPSTDPDRELFGQGLANVASGLAGGMPATGAIARTAVNVRAGARTRVASMTHGLVLLVVLLGASGIVAHIPIAALAGVLMVTATRMVDMTSVRTILRASRSDALVFAATAVTTVAFDLVLAVEVGFVVAMVLVLRTTAQASRILEEDLATRVDHVADDELRALLHQHVVVYRLEGSLFFGAAQRFLDELTALDDARVVVLRLGWLQVLDATGAHALIETIDVLQSRGIMVLVCGAQDRHAKVLDAVGIPGDHLDGSRLFTQLDAALDRARAIVAA
jgi:SulP family sulfate permease